MDLKSYLKNSGVRQSAFAALVGKSQGYVSRVAAGECLLSAATALTWAAATGHKVTPHDLRPDLYPNPTDGLPNRTAA